MKSGIESPTRACKTAEDEIKRASEKLEEAESRIAGLKGVAAVTAARTAGDAAIGILETDKAKKSAKECTDMQAACVKACENDPDGDKECKAPGTEDDRDREKRKAEAYRDKVEKQEKESKSAGAGKSDGKDDKEKGKGQGGGEGGGMPEIPKPQEGEKKKPEDPSCSGNTPGAGCAPKDDPCMKDPRSVACLCQGDGPKPEECFRKSEKTKVNTGADGGGSASDPGGLVSGASIGESSDRSSGRSRGGGGSSGGGGFGGGGSGGGSGLGRGGGSSASGASFNDSPGVAGFGGSSSSSSGLGGGGGYGGGGGGSGGSYSGLGSRASKTDYERLAEQGASVAHRRINGMSGEVGGRHGNLFEQASRAYRSHGSRLVKAAGGY